MPVNGISVIVDFLIFDIRRSAARIGVRSQGCGSAALALRIWLMAEPIPSELECASVLGLVVRANSERPEALRSIRRWAVMVAWTAPAARPLELVTFLANWLGVGRWGNWPQIPPLPVACCATAQAFQHQGNGYDRG